MDTVTLGAALALAKKIPGAAISEAWEALDEARRVLASIPTDYTQLSDNVDQLTDRVDTLETKEIPAGGSTGDVLTKRSGTDYDTQWSNGNEYMKKSEYDVDGNGKVDVADTADSVQGPGVYRAQLKSTGANTYLVTDAEKGVPNGVPPLDNTGKIPLRYLPDGIEELNAKTLPAGGAIGSVLTKRSGANYDAQWTNGDIYMTKSQYDRDDNGRVDRADVADSVQGPGSYKARLKNTVTDTYFVTDVDKGVANGVVPLDSTGKILPEYLPDSIMNGLTNGGIFNADTRTVTLSDAAKSILHVTTNTMVLENTDVVPAGYPANAELYYITTVGGVFAGMNFTTGDWLISLGNQWQQLVNGNQVSSVQGQTGAV